MNSRNFVPSVSVTISCLALVASVAPAFANPPRNPLDRKEGAITREIEYLASNGRVNCTTFEERRARLKTSYCELCGTVLNPAGLGKVQLRQNTPVRFTGTSVVTRKGAKGTALTSATAVAEVSGWTKPQGLDTSAPKPVPMKLTLTCAGDALNDPARFEKLLKDSFVAAVKSGGTETVSGAKNGN